MFQRSVLCPCCCDFGGTIFIWNIRKFPSDCMISDCERHAYCSGCQIQYVWCTVIVMCTVIMLCDTGKNWCILVAWPSSAFSVFIPTVLLSLVCTVHVADITTWTGCVPESSGTESAYSVPCSHCQGIVHTLAAHEAIPSTTRSDRWYYRLKSLYSTIWSFYLHEFQGYLSGWQQEDTFMCVYLMVNCCQAVIC